MPYNWGNYGPYWNNPGQVIPVQGNPQDFIVTQTQQSGLLTYAQIVEVQNAMANVTPPVAPAPEVPAIDLPAEEGNMINDFRVGCDPEFILLDAGNKTVAASRYFQQIGEIGYDHGGRVAEFRPGPSKGVLPILKKIQELVRKTPAGLKLRAGALCNGDCLGGHVHFGFNGFEQKPLNGFGILNGGGKFNERGAQVTKALDALTKALEHLDLLPNNESAKRRASTQGSSNAYGAYGDVRDCHGHMEYRTMASWLYDPKVAFLCLTAAKLAASDPVRSYDELKTCDNFKDLGKWLASFKNKDVNATRVSEKLIEPGLKKLQIDPDINFRGRWEHLGI